MDIRHGLYTISTLSVRIPYDFRTISVDQNVDESQSKKSYDVFMKFKRIRRSTPSPTMSKNRKENRRPRNRTMNLDIKLVLTGA